MELDFIISLMLVFASNVFFFFSGICLNSLVILSFWRSVQLRKKVCYFMIMVLSCNDLLAVLTNHPLLALTAMLWSTGKLDHYSSWMIISFDFTDVFLSCSFLALLVMNFDRYLATHHPLFHRTSITKRRLLNILGIVIFVQLTLKLMSVNDFVYSSEVYHILYQIIFFPPIIFINYKLFSIARKSRKDHGISSEMKKRLKNVSSCLLAFACFAVLSIPAAVYTGVDIASKTTPALSDNAMLARFWTKTFFAMNATWNCLIFYWKNKILRIEGMKVIKTLKMAGKSRSPPHHALDNLQENTKM